VRDVRNLLYIWKHFGEEDAQIAFDKAGGHANWPPDKPRPSLSAVLAGKINYIGGVKGLDDPIFQTLAAALAEVSPQFKYASPPSESITVRVVTEGPTDAQHLSAALAWFHRHGEFTALQAAFDTDSPNQGDASLARYFRDLPPTMPQKPTIALFDRDNENVLRTEGLHQQDFVDRGNGVGVAALVVPSLRDAPICIEMLYPDKSLALTNADGRRIYLRSEFNEATGHHISEPCNIVNRQNKTLVRDDVVQFVTGATLALSKADFAEAVLNQSEPFDSVDFDGFRATFEMILRHGRRITRKVDRPDPSAS
jgi:RNA-directed DNA polymerase